MLLMSTWLLLVVTGDGSINFGLCFFFSFLRVPELSSTVCIRANAAAPMLYSAGSY